MYSVEERSKIESATGRSFCLFSKPKEKQRCFGEVDDQYGTCDLRTGGLGAASSGTKQGSDKNGYRFPRCVQKMFFGGRRANSPLLSSHASERRKWMNLGGGLWKRFWMWWGIWCGV